MTKARPTPEPATMAALLAERGTALEALRAELAS